MFFLKCFVDLICVKTKFGFFSVTKGKDNN